MFQTTNQYFIGVMFTNSPIFEVSESQYFPISVNWRLRVMGGFADSQVLGPSRHTRTVLPG